MFHMINFSLPKLGGATRTDRTTSSAASKSIKVKELSELEKKILFTALSKPKSKPAILAIVPEFSKSYVPLVESKKNS